MEDFINKDTIMLFGYLLTTSTIIVWLTAMAGFALNIFVNRKYYMAMSRETRLRDIAKDAFLKAEKVAKLTGIKGDDKLLEYLSQAIQAFKISYGKKPSGAEIKLLTEQAAAMAAEEKMFREPVIEKIAVAALAVPESKKEHRPAVKAKAKKRK